MRIVGSVEGVDSSLFPNLAAVTAMPWTVGSGIKVLGLPIGMEGDVSFAQGLVQAAIQMLKEALKHWFVPTDLIREYYGDSVAMYYSWMNF